MTKGRARRDQKPKGTVGQGWVISGSWLDIYIPRSTHAPRSVAGLGAVLRADE